MHPSFLIKEGQSIMKYQSTTDPGFQTMDNIFQPKTSKMRFAHSPRNGHPPLRQHQQNSALIHLLCCKVLSQEKHTSSAQEHRGAEQSCAQGRSRAQGFLQPTLKLKSPRVEVVHVCCGKSKGFIGTFYKKA